ncbi:unnamed protein product [Paramecium sonneborni]|uniref:Transmembrane protein n=1 Tax=Paramecium sonneborni TaxID=65129 RepID=A0A8S1NIP7_9CILI|nr:unnamed protein product [Paramecium sonneborni]
MKLWLQMNNVMMKIMNLLMDVLNANIHVHLIVKIALMVNVLIVKMVINQTITNVKKSVGTEQRHLMKCVMMEIYYLTMDAQKYVKQKYFGTVQLTKSKEVYVFKLIIQIYNYNFQISLLISNIFQ